jgi:ATP-dependent Clp protease adaptor protein ClpS
MSELKELPLPQQQDLIAKQNKLVLHNDEVNTFDYVIDCLIKVCGHQPEQAEQCAMIVHYNGKCAVKSGEYGYLKLLKEILMDHSLTVSIE